MGWKEINSGSSNSKKLDSGTAGFEGKWNNKTQPPYSVRDHASAAVNGKIYIIGDHSTFKNGSKKVSEYDPDNNSWTRLSDAPVKLQDNGVCTWTNEIYITGNLGGFRKYNPSNDTWTNLNNPPFTGGNSPGLAATNGKIYQVAGGEVGYGNQRQDVYEYDISSNSWTPVSAINRSSGIRNGNCHAVNGKVYHIGGYGYPGSGHFMDTSVRVYDPSSDNWQTVHNINLGGATSLYRSSSAVVNDKIYMAGNGGADDYVFEYDPVENTSRQVRPLNNGRQDSAAAAANGKMYVSGGNANTFEEYEPGPKPENVASASKDGVVVSDNPDAIIKNESTGRTANPNIVNKGETISWYSNKNARLRLI